MIRQFIPADYVEIKKWIDVPMKTFPQDSTFVALLDGELSLVLSVYYTNSLELAVLENFAGNPAHKGEKRRSLAEALVRYVESQATAKGFHRLICLAPNKKLKRRYQELGYSVVLDKISCLAREI